MSIPGNALTLQTEAVALQSPDNLARINKTTDYEIGGVALNDASQGLFGYTWRCRLDGNNVKIGRAPYTTETTIITEAGITELTFTFSQLMGVTLAYIQAGVAKLRWFDSTIPGIITTTLPAGITSVFLTLDDKRDQATLGGTSDILLFYVQNSVLIYTQQRDRFNTPRTLYTLTGTEGTIVSAGMTTDLRIQVSVTELYSRLMPDDSCQELKIVSATGESVISAAQKKSGIGSLLLPVNPASNSNGIEVINHPDFNFGAQDFTIEFWAYRLAASGAGKFLIHNAGTNSITLTYNGTSGLFETCSLVTSIGTKSITVTGVAFPLLQWVNVVLQRRGLAIELYVSGILAGSVAVTALESWNSNANWFFGRSSVASTNNHNGYLDEIMVSRETAKYTSNFTPSLPDRICPLGSIWGDRGMPASSAVPIWRSQWLAQTTTPDTLISAPAVQGWSVPLKVAVDGIGGGNSAIIYGYQRGTTTPAQPTGSSVYTFATSALTGLTEGWSQTVPPGTDNLYVIAASAFGTGTTDTIAANEWSSAQLLGSSGTGGLNSATVFLYQRTLTAVAPALPSVATTYTFSTSVASGMNNGWSQSLPSTGGSFRWLITATAASVGTFDNITPAEWAAAAILSQDGANGANNAVIYAYQRGTSAPAQPTATSSYTFATGALVNLDGGWLTAIPSGIDNLYVIATSAFSSEPTDTIAANEWSLAQLLSGGGGLNSATVFIYQRTATSTAPSLPSVDVTYSFATSLAAGLNNGWGQSLPTSGGIYRWVTTATAASSGGSDVIAPSEWANVAILSQDGINGTSAITLKLTAPSVTVAADSTGFVTSYTGAFTDIRVDVGEVNETANWTLSRIDGPTTTSTLTATRLQLNDLSADTGSIGVRASKAGFPTQQATFSVAKARSSNVVSGVIQNGFFSSSRSYSTFTGTTAGVSFESNGTVRAVNFNGTYEAAGNWYVPATVNIGGAYWIRVTLSAGVTTNGITINSWVSLSSGQEVFINGGNQPRESELSYEISSSSSGTPVVGTGIISLYVEGNYGGGPIP